MPTRRRRNPREGGYDDRSAMEAFAAAQDRPHLKGAYADAHRRALATPNTLEKGIVGMILGWLVYAEAHRFKYGSPVGEDGYAGPEWYTIGKSIEALLSMDIGRLDGGALDSGIREAMLSQGFTEKELDEGL